MHICNSAVADKASLPEDKPVLILLERCLDVVRSLAAQVRQAVQFGCLSAGVMVTNLSI